jgi:hypothetical protein
MDQGAAPEESNGPSDRPAIPANRRRRTILIIEAVVIAVAALATVAAFVSRSKSDDLPPAATGTGAPAPARPATSTPTFTPSPMVTGGQAGSVTATAGAPVRFGAITVTDQVLHAEPTTPVAFQLVVHYPAVSGLGDAARQAQVNALLRSRADAILADFASEFGAYPAGSGDNGFAIVSNQAQVAGKLLSVRSDTAFRFPGAGSLNQGTSAITVRFDTAQTVPVPAMFTARAMTDTGVRALTFGLMSVHDIADCNANDGYGSAQVRDALTKAVNGRDGSGVAVTVTADSLRISFGTGVIGPNSCGVVSGLLSFTSLATLVDPGLVALATSGP